MLLIRYLFEEYHKQPTEIRADLYNALKTGLARGLLTREQVHAVIKVSFGYRLHEIGVTPECINAALYWIESHLGYTDYNCIRRYKGEVKPQWIAKAVKLSEVWDEGNDT